MDFALDAGQRAWLTEVREFLHENVTAELQSELAAARPASFPTARSRGFVARSGRRAGSDSTGRASTEASGSAPFISTC